MLRKVLPLSLLPFLAACGGDDFSLQIDKPASVVASELAKVKPNVLTASAGVDPVTKQQLEGGSVLYTLPNQQGEEGTVLFEVVERDANKTSVNVTVEIPTITRNGAEGAQILSESKMETALKGAMRTWEQKLEAGRSTAGPLDEVSEMVSLFAIGMQDFDQFESTAMAALLDKYDTELARAEWAGPGSADWGESEGETEWAYDDAERDNYTADRFATQDDYGDESGGWGDQASD